MPSHGQTEDFHERIEQDTPIVAFVVVVVLFLIFVGGAMTGFNQYDSIVLPVTTRLKDRGVQFVVGAKVTCLDFK